MFCLLIATGCRSVQNKMFYQRGDVQTYHGPALGSDGLIKDIKLVLVWVEPGSFDIGKIDPDFVVEKPLHLINITRGYWMGRTEITQDQWVSVMGYNPSFFSGDKLPVEKVSWFECTKFCKKLTQRERRAGRLPEGYVYRLPTEAEWEFAAIGGVKSKGYLYAGSDDIDEVAWYNGNSGNKTQPVGQRQPNELGLYDMSGNVYEWCHDWLEDYVYTEKTDPKGPDTGNERIVRGGSWSRDPDYCRATYRDESFKWSPKRSHFAFGFRVVLAPVIR
ncbi:MAG: formylglycine-generating enzyme family protein [Lentisphaerae bacterium]|nr:formylglycine-generating enzyme family protein [Lentisphaerota bacterium]